MFCERNYAARCSGHPVGLSLVFRSRVGQCLFKPGRIKASGDPVGPDDKGWRTKKSKSHRLDLIARKDRVDDLAMGFEVICCLGEIDIGLR